LFSKGYYVTGTIELKSNVMLEISKGAKILGSIKLVDYPEKIESFKSVMSEIYCFRQSLIYAEKATNIGIRGEGEIYFRGEKENFPGPQTTGKIEGRPLGIRMIECKNVVLQNILLRNSASWMQNYVCCENLIFEGIKVINQANYNNDGLDPDGCKNVIVRNCFINSEDDAMCIKGASNRTSENILIENSTFYSSCNAFKIGTDTQGSFKNIFARNLILGGIPDSLESLLGNQASTGITLTTVDGGNIEDVIISNVTINQSRCPIFIRIGNRGRVIQGIEKPNPGYITHILIDSVKGNRNFRQGSLISGLKGYPITDVVIRNMNIRMEGGGTLEMANSPLPENEGVYSDALKFSKNGLPSYGFYIRHAQNIFLENIEIIPEIKDYRPAFKLGDDVKNIIINKRKFDK
jgi:polygalacturonase